MRCTFKTAAVLSKDPEGSRFFRVADGAGPERVFAFSAVLDRVRPGDFYARDVFQGSVSGKLDISGPLNGLVAEASLKAGALAVGKLHLGEAEARAALDRRHGFFWNR